MADKQLKNILISEQDLKRRISELGEQLSKDYEGKEVMLVGVLKGAFIFMANLAMEMQVPVSVDFMAVSSYGASTDSSGVVRILKDLDLSVEGKDILIVEDIVDSGLTLKYITENIASREPASLKICTLLNKEKKRKADVKIDYVGFQIPDRFVVGYGLDFAERYRNLRYIAVLEENPR